MKKAGAILLISGPILLLHGCSLLEPGVEELADVDSEILGEMSLHAIPAVAAGVISGDSLVWQRYYGYADVAAERAATEESIYELASVSKLVLVTAVMQLWEKGLIDLKADIDSYLPFSVRNPHHAEEPITPHLLLTHTSGLAWPKDDYEVPGFYDYHPMDSAPALDEWLPECVLPGGARYVPAVWKATRPGEGELYSNIGTALLGYIVELVSGTDFNSYCREHIFDPLEMYNTSYAYADLDMAKLVRLYVDRHEPIDYYRQLHFPAQALKSTIEDFSHFLIAYMNGGRYRGERILEESTVNEILTIRNPASGLCLIWYRGLGDWYGHSGGEPGAAAYVEFQRDGKVGLMVFSNRRNKSVYPGNRIHAVVRRIARTYF